MSRNIVRKSDIGAPPARMSAGAPPSLPVRRASRAGFRNVRTTVTPNRKRRSEGNLEMEDSDSEQASTADDQEENGSGEEGIKKEEEQEQEEKVKKTPRKKRRFRLTDSIAKSKRRAERRAQLAAERKEREESKQQEDEPIEEEKERTPTPPPVPKVPAILTYSPMQLFCDNILKKMKAKDPDEYFAFPVTQSMAPDYHEVIKEPMDFATIRQKIEKDEYPDIASMKKDAELIVRNAMDYNSPGTVYHVAAQKMDLNVQFYFSEQNIRYLYHALPFTKDIPLEKLGLTPKTHPRPAPKADYKSAVIDNATAETVLDGVDPSMRPKLSSRIPDLSVLPADSAENGVEPKCHLAFLDNKDGAVCLNVVNPNSAEQKTVTLGDLMGKLQEGTPGLCAPQEHKSNNQVPISYVSYGPFSSFAPQFDSTWATLCERDSRLLLSTYGDRSNVTNAISLRQMVDNAGEHMIKVVDDLLDTLTDGEHRRTIKTLETEEEKNKEPVDLEKLDLNKLLNDVVSLENLGIDVSFVSDVRKLYKLQTVTETPQDTLDKTGTMINDLALLQKNRLSSAPPTTLTDQPAPNNVEVNLASRIQGQLQTQIAQYAKPGNVISPPVIHNAVGLNEEDIDLLNEFFTAPPTTTAVQ